jgi:hypothetical protein
VQRTTDLEIKYQVSFENFEKTFKFDGLFEKIGFAKTTDIFLEQSMNNSNEFFTASVPL